MTNKVVGILGNVVPGQPNPEVVELLEEALEMAKRGEINSVGIVRLDAEGCANTAWTHKSQYFALMGAVSLLHHRLLAD